MATILSKEQGISMKTSQNKSIQDRITLLYFFLIIAALILFSGLNFGGTNFGITSSNGRGDSATTTSLADGTVGGCSGGSCKPSHGGEKPVPPPPPPAPSSPIIG